MEIIEILNLDKPTSLVKLKSGKEKIVLTVELQEILNKQLLIHGVVNQQELLQKLENIKTFKWGIDARDNERRMCELIMLL